MRYLPLLILAYLLSGCIGQYYHSRDDIWNLGYSDTQLASDTWRVSYKGYAIAEDKAADFALFRGSQVCLKAGFPYFTIEEGRETSSPQGVGYISRGTGLAATYQYPNASFTIRGYSSRPKTIRQVYESQFVSNSIKAKYNLKN